MAATAMAQRDLTGLGEIHALLGRGTEFDGVLAFEGRVRVDGRFKGRIFSEGVLILGDGAEVEAEIEVGTLIVRGGTLRGNVVARQLIEIHAEGRVHGDIAAPQIDIDKGCLFEGKCTMTQAAEPESGELVPPDDEPAR
jgi:cytoskeletal protein CcmA (bactofilin family)